MTKNLLPLLFLAYLSTLASAKLHVVGDNHQWRDGINYTDWTLRNHFYEQDWLVFYFQKGVHDVIQVRNKSAYEYCLTDDPILNWSRGHSFAIQLNQSGRYYFVCSRGHCYSGMKISILVEPLPSFAPASPPPSISSSAVLSSSSAAIASVIAALNRLQGGRVRRIKPLRRQKQLQP
ncbi:early nodulin-like protein 19 [Wolffia australiana]